MAVEFDTYESGELADPNGNHISVQTCGKQPNSSHHRNSLACSTAIGQLNDGQTHKVRVALVNSQLFVFLDDLEYPLFVCQVSFIHSFVHSFNYSIIDVKYLSD